MIEIRSLNKLEELEKVRQLESKIWGDNDSIPSHQTLTAVKNGGLVLGAFDKEELVGFQYSFPGFNGKTAYLCSHILGTDERYRNQGIGEKLKHVQREEALKLGYSLITWTYDPLESVNGYLNISKLGGVSSTYIENCYGEMEDLLNSGIPSDRFLVEWHLNKDQETFSDIDLDTAIKKSLIQWNEGQNGVPEPFLTHFEPESDLAYVAFPRDYRTIRETNTEIALDWRLRTREVFSKLFEEKWQVTGFIANKKLPVSFYVLRKK
ncbi:GNAT family N-acetyltransferase [Fictibacillus sp. NPDC058756]|uniref:GNAT family N-acetyltransferase n=1 Tax=Fictibacillus sp. NPDC058756 TaxID=3346625 RepID=UPI0036ADD312